MWKPTLLHRCQYLPKLITENYWLIMNPLAQRLLTCTLILGEEVPFVLVEVKHCTYTYTYTYIYIYIYIYIYSAYIIMIDYIEYARFQPFGCGQKKNLEYLG